MSVLGIAPVKVNSKRLPRKNLKMLNGMPLFMHSLKVLIDSKVADKIIVCSEDDLVEEILWGNDVGLYNQNLAFLKRPQYLSEDPMQISDVCLWVIERLEEKYDDLVIIQPSNPFVLAEDIKDAFYLYDDGFNKEYQMRSALEIKKNIWCGGKKYLLMDIIGNDDACYVGNGSIVIESIKRLQKKGGLLTYCIPYLMPKERSIDIDDEMDFQIAEMLMKRK